MTLPGSGTPLDRETGTRSTPSPEQVVNTPGGPAASSRAPGPRGLRPVVVVGSLVLTIASRLLAGVKHLWNRVPRGVRAPVHAVLDSTGVPYVLNYLAGYDERHQLRNFAGNLGALNAAYIGSPAEGRDGLTRQFKGIVDALVMKNGVTKSTHPMRQNRILRQVLADPRCRLDRCPITVLELPASTGVAALDNFATLSQQYRIGAYVLGDLFWHLYYDTARECIFDEEFNLLQVKVQDGFFSIYRSASSGERYRALAAFLLSPFELVSRYLKRKYRYSENSGNVLIRVLHPEVEARVITGDLTVKRMDIFSEIEDRYDVILCFNLLLREYFRQDQIAKGIDNLKNALHEQGFLILGDGVSFSVAQKRGGQLCVVKREGRSHSDAVPGRSDLSARMGA
jgi:hypothetical protein